MTLTEKLTVKDFRFGIELELGNTTGDLRQKISFKNGWHVHGEHCGSEIVSPPLRGFSGLLDVRRMLKQLWTKYNEISFHDAGLHVHVDIQHFTLKNAKRLLILASLFDEAIFSVMSGNRYKNRYTYHCRYSISKIKKCMTIADLQRLQSHDRYHGMNMFAFPKHGTVEFRYAMGTADWSKIYAIISMYLRMVALAGSTTKINEKVTKVSTITQRNSKEQLPNLKKLKKEFFDALQLRGEVRQVLDDMFKKNATKITSNSAPVEKYKPVRGLKIKKG